MSSSKAAPFVMPPSIIAYLICLCFDFDKGAFKFGNCGHLLVFFLSSYCHTQLFAQIFSKFMNSSQSLFFIVYSDAFDAYYKLLAEIKEKEIKGIKDIKSVGLRAAKPFRLYCSFRLFM